MNSAAQSLLWCRRAQSGLRLLPARAMPLRSSLRWGLVVGIIRKGCWAGQAKHGHSPHIKPLSVGQRIWEGFLPCWGARARRVGALPVPGSAEASNAHQILITFAHGGLMYPAFETCRVTSRFRSEAANVAKSC